ncbi:MAG: YicC/YloC family endoribonuclease [Gemmatimonadota bacterium]|nr:YicC family protein [Gemmatimonadota bacterium]
MIRSMTGFGECTRETERGTLRVEIKSVNHRFFNSSIRLPSGADRWEARVVELLKESVQRGHVTYSLGWERGSISRDGTLPELDLERARAYHGALLQMQEELGLAGPPDLRTMARFSDLFRADPGARVFEIEEDLLVEMTRAALVGFVEQRRAEGTRLEADLRRALGVLLELAAVVEERAPQRLLAERDRLRTQIRELTEGVEVDEDRLAREVAYLAERWDLNEELVRLRSHVQLFTEALDGPDHEGVGKRLGFVVQEMNREANTIASKANDATIQRAAVGMKEEIERIREQVENVE